MSGKDEESLTPQERLHGVAANRNASTSLFNSFHEQLELIRGALDIYRVDQKVHGRSVHVDGDRFYHAKFRSRPTEKAILRVLKDLKKIAADLERLNYERSAFDDKVRKTDRERRERAAKKALEAGLPPQEIASGNDAAAGDGQAADGGSGPVASIYDLRDERSA